MVGEFTLFSTLAVHHLIIGSALVLTLLGISRVTVISAELKSWLWMTAFISSTVLPMTLLVPQSPAEDKIIVTGSVSVQDDARVQGISDPVVLSKPAEQDNVWHMPMEWVYFYGPLMYIFVAIWMVGSLWRASYLLKRLRFTHSIKQDALQTPIAIQHGDLQNLTICVSSRIQSPMVIGIFKPCIILPQTMADKLPLETLLPVLLHEKAHIKRFDVAFSLFQELVAIVFWWSPVIRVLNHNVHISRELACDMRAAVGSQGHKAYAQSLLECARLMVKQKQSVLAMSLFSRKKELNYRIESVLQNNRRSIPKMGYSLLACVVMSLVTVAAAHSFSPKISVAQVNDDARHYSLLGDVIGRALIEAVINQDIAAIQAMQQQGIDIDTPARRDGTALMIAVKRNDMRMVNALLQLGANVDQSSLGDGNPLIIAAQRNNLTMAQLLIDQGADVNKVVPRDETPLINATRNGFMGMTQLLVQNGADVNLAVRTGYSDGYALRSPLNMARTQTIREYLVAMGAETEP